MVPFDRTASHLARAPCGCGRLPPLSCLSRSLAAAFRASALSRSLSRLGSGEGVGPLRLAGGLCFPLSLLLHILRSSCRSFSGSDPGHHTSIPWARSNRRRRSRMCDGAGGWRIITCPSVFSFVNWSSSLPSLPFVASVTHRPGQATRVLFQPRRSSRSVIAGARSCGLGPSSGPVRDLRRAEERHP